MTNIFREILDTRSFHAIDFMCEDALNSQELSSADRDALKRLYETNSLDERYALAHEQLGEFDKAAELRRWTEQSSKNKEQRMLQAKALLLET